MVTNGSYGITRSEVLVIALLTTLANVAGGFGGLF
jgi:hypothetical protein